MKSETKVALGIMTWGGGMLLTIFLPHNLGFLGFPFTTVGGFIIGWNLVR